MGSCCVAVPCHGEEWSPRRAQRLCWGLHPSQAAGPQQQPAGAPWCCPQARAQLVPLLQLLQHCLLELAWEPWDEGMAHGTCLSFCCSRSRSPALENTMSWPAEMAKMNSTPCIWAASMRDRIRAGDKAEEGCERWETRYRWRGNDCCPMERATDTQSQKRTLKRRAMGRWCPECWNTEDPPQGSAGLGTLEHIAKDLHRELHGQCRVQGDTL